MNSPPPTSSVLSFRRLLLTFGGLAIAVAAGGLAFFNPTWDHGPHLVARVPLGELLATIRSARPLLLAGLLLCTAGCLPMRALQIRITARAVDGTPRFRALLRAVGAGLLGQNALPAKLGEAARFLLLRNDARIPVPVSIAAAAIDRTLDASALFIVGILIPVGFGLEVGHIPVLHQALPQLAGAILVLAILIGILVAAYAPLARSLRPRFKGAADLIERLGHSARYAASPRRIIPGLATAITLVLLYSLGIQFAFQSLHLTAPAGASLVLVALIFLASSIPGAPSAAGTFHATVVFGTHLMGIPDRDGLALAVLLHAFDVGGTTIAALVAFFGIRGSPLRWQDLSAPDEAKAPTDARPVSRDQRVSDFSGLTR
jgi:uncharacterized protein (TIRG00374 family)